MSIETSDIVQEAQSHSSENVSISSALGSFDFAAAQQRIHQLREVIYSWICEILFAMKVFQKIFLYRRSRDQSRISPLTSMLFLS